MESIHENRLSFGLDRVQMEKVVIASSWSDPISAQDLFHFPEDAWIRVSHRKIVDVIREMVAAGEDLLDVLIELRLRKVDPDIVADFHAIRAYYQQDVLSISGAARKQLLEEFREELAWQNAYYLTSGAQQKIRQEPFSTWLHNLQTGMLKLASGEQEQKRPTFDVVMRNRIAEHRKGVANVNRIDTTIPELDESLRGMLPGQMVMLIGPPGMGKTTLAMQLAVNLSIQGHKTLFNQLEMSEEEMADRAMAMAVKKPNPETYTEEDYAKAEQSASLLKNMTLIDEGCDLAEWERRTRLWLYRNPDAKCVITDYAGLLQDHGAKVDPTRAANAVSEASKRIAKAHGIVHILLQQPSKKYDEDKKPSVSHIRDSGKFRQDAHKILFLHHPHYWNSDYPEDYLQLHILKNRGGKLGQIAHLEWKPGWYIMRQWKYEVPNLGLKRKRLAAPDPAQAVRERQDDNMEDLELPL